MNDESQEYHTKVVWTGGKSGEIHVEDRSTIITGNPLKSEDGEEGYSPEELLVAAATVCFMNSFVYFTKKMRIDDKLKSFECESIGTLSKVGRSFEITHLLMKATVVIESEDLRKKFDRALELGDKYCYVSNSLKAQTKHENVIIIG